MLLSHLHPWTTLKRIASSSELLTEPQNSFVIRSSHKKLATLYSPLICEISGNVDFGMCFM